MKSCNVFVTIIILFHSFAPKAQERFTTLRGQVKDAVSHHAIPSASIQTKTGSAGTVTNLRGEFVFKLPGIRARDTLVISCIGFLPRSVALTAADTNLVINLSPAPVELATVTVKAQSALDIFKAAVRNIPDNYDTTDTEFTAFYRENVWLGDFELSFSEAILDIYKTYTTGNKLNDQIRILKGRKKSIDYGKDGQVYWWMSGVSNGARGTLANDMVKYRMAKFSAFNPANYRFYEFKFLEKIKEGERGIIVITISPKRKARKGLVNMKVYIDEESLAIMKYDYHLSEKGVRIVERKDKGVAYGIMSTVLHVTSDYHQFYVSVSYNERKGKWYLNRVTQQFQIYVNSKKRNWKNRLWRSDMDLVMTAVQTENVKPITEGDIGGKVVPMHTLINGKFDDEFWEHYNILKPIQDSVIVMDSIGISNNDPTILTDNNPGDEKASLLKEFPTSARSAIEKNVGLLNEDPHDSLYHANLNDKKIPNRQNGFTRGDTLRGKLTPLRTCYDVLFYHLDVAVDMSARTVNGSNLIRFKVEKPFNKIQIDLFSNLKIDSIVFRNNLLPFTREFNAVFIEFPSQLETGEVEQIIVYYNGKPKIPDWTIPMDGGVLWDKDSLGNDWAQVVCQGSGASLWWPNKDHQSDEPDSMKIWITVPDTLTEISNGRLIQKTPMPGNQLRYEWKVSYPINNYNVTFNIGKYVHYHDQFVSNDTLSIDYYVMPYNLKRSRKLFTQVKPMLKTFETYFGKYPFYNDGFSLVESLYPMEHQSGVCIGKITSENSTDTNPLLWHESAHEWWGNSITSKDIADMWIHEAFATYAETLVIEDRFGKELANHSMISQLDAVIGKEPVTGVYDVNHIHYNIGDMYSKGSLMLHTFRHVLNNDDAWIKLLLAIQRHFKYKTLSAADLIQFINRETKTDYSYFFDQYLNYKDPPALEVTLKESGNDLIIKYRWVANVADFRMPVKVTKSIDRFDFIHPTTKWQTTVLKSISASEFDVDDEAFYFDLRLQ